MERKLYPCKQCGTKVKIRSKGLCPYCRQQQKGGVVKQYRIKQQRSETRKKRKNRNELLKKFFTYHLNRIQSRPICENCGCRVQGNLMNIAHILPKRSTANPEVMDDLNNCMYLCASINGGEEKGCHEHFDRVQGSSKVYLMLCFPIALERYIKLAHLIEHNNKYVQVFKQAIEDKIENEDK